MPSSVEVEENVTFNGAGPDAGVALMPAVGGLFSVTVTTTVAELVAPSSSVTVSVAVQLPGSA